MVLGLTLVAACSGTGANSSRNLIGRLAAPECGGGFEIENAQVVLRNQANDIVGTATTGNDLTPSIPGICVLDYKINAVPDAKFFSLKIGSHEGPAWSASELEAQHYKADLALGDTEIPRADPTAFCEMVPRIHETLLDTNTLNKHPAEWHGSLSAYGDALTSLAAGFELAGDSHASQAVEMLEVGDSLDKADSYMTVSKLNATLEPVNTDMLHLIDSLHCDITWTDVSYSAG